MKITKVQTVRVPTVRHAQLGYLVLVYTDQGITGLGEVASDCHRDTVAHAISQMDLVGRDASQIESFWLSFGVQDTFWRGGPIWTSAVSGIEQALWDIKGKQLGVPVYELLGGKLRDRIRLYTHTRFDTADPDAFAASAEKAVSEGFSAVKFDPLGNAYQTMTPQEMRIAVERVRLTRNAIGPDADLLIEGHGRLTPTMAIRMARSFEEFEPFFFEEPVPPENVDEMAKVAASVNIPIAAGERLYTRWGFRELLEKQVADYIQPDLCHCGGFAEGRKIAAMAETYHVRVLPHNPNGPISTLVGLHLGACTPNFEMLEYPRRPENMMPLLKGVPEPSAGYIQIPDAPGWGAEIDDSVLTNLTDDQGV